MIKIGFLVEAMRFGGGERMLFTLINEIIRLGHKVQVYTWNLEWKSFQKIDQSDIVLLTHAPVRLRGKLRSYKELIGVLKKNKPECLITFSLHAAEIGVVAANHLNIPTIVSERVDPRYLPKKLIHRILKKVIFSLSDAVIFQTDTVKNYFSSRIQKKGFVIPNMLMEDNWPKDIQLNPRKEIIAIGRLSEEKNFETLIRIFAELNLQGYILRIFGNGPERSKLMDLTSELDIEAKVVLEGEVDSIKDHIINSDIFVIISKHEGMPNALMEAMAAGLACVSYDFDSGGASSLIANTENGLVIPLNDVNALKAAIKFLVDNPGIKNRIKNNALKIQQTHAKKLIANKWHELVVSLVTLKI